MEGWGTRLAEVLAGTAVTGLLGMAKWVANMHSKIDDHERRVEEIEEEQGDCRNRCHDTMERMSLSEQRHTHFQETVAELKADVKELLRHVRSRNGGSI